MPKQCIILASGASIRQGLWDTPIEYMPIWNVANKVFTITVNWSYKWCIPNIAVFVDYKFYMTEKEGLDKLPCVVGRNDSFYTDTNRYLKYHKTLSPNLCLLDASKNQNIDGKGMRAIYHGKEAWEKGFYSSQLSGIWALNLAIALGYDEIFLLGYDGCETDGYTHFYQPEGIGTTVWEGRKNSGVGKHENGRYKTGTYNNDINYWFEPFKVELDSIKIYNVSPQSKIEIFPKITYKEFYNKIK